MSSFIGGKNRRRPHQQHLAGCTDGQGLGGREGIGVGSAGLGIPVLEVASIQKAMDRVLPLLCVRVHVQTYRLVGPCAGGSQHGEFRDGWPIGASDDRVIVPSEPGVDFLDIGMIAYMNTKRIGLTRRAFIRANSSSRPIPLPALSSRCPSSQMTSDIR